MIRADIQSASWPPGKWKLEYIKEIDRYRITTIYGDFIADVGPTLVAFWILDYYNINILPE